MTSAITFASAFGLPSNTKDIYHLVQSFDFSKLQSSNIESSEYLNFKLAPSFGTLTSESLKMMDDKLKIIISGTTRDLAKLEDKSWENVLSVLLQNPLVEPMEDTKPKTDKLVKNYGTSLFKVDGSPDHSIVKEVDARFKNFIGDEDILRSTGIDINILGKIVAAIGARIDSFETFFAKKEYREQTMIEIGVLRYPDIDNPFFKVYRIKLVAWSDCQRVLFVQYDKNGITCEFTVRRFKPRDSVLDGLKKEVKDKAIKQAEALFD